MSGDIGFGSTSPVAATSAPKLTLDTNFNRKSSGTMGTTGTIGTPGTSGGTVPTTPQIPRSSSQSGGFASPYLLASGLLSPKSGGGAGPGGIVSSSSPINENGPLRIQLQIQNILVILLIKFKTTISTKFPICKYH